VPIAKIDDERCPRCGRAPAIVYVSRRQDPLFPAGALFECEGCQEGWDALLTPHALIELNKTSSLPVDYSRGWVFLDGEEP
jgi:hypothetical protein